MESNNSRMQETAGAPTADKLATDARNIGNTNDRRDVNNSIVATARISGTSTAVRTSKPAGST